jgi:hypothetical protein
MALADILKELSLEDQIALFRLLYSQFSPDVKTRETKIINRIQRGTKIILAEPVDNATKVFRFNSVYDLVMWLRNQGFKSASSANVYKVLNGERPSAYGYKYRHEE